MNVSVAKVLHGILLLVLLLPSLAYSAIDDSHIQRLRLDIWSIRADFYMMTIMRGAVDYEDLLHASIDRAQNTFEELSENAESDTELALVDEVEGRWDGMIELAQSNTIVELGYLDSYVAQDLNAAIVQINQKLEAFEGAEKSAHSDLLVLASAMQRMASEYLMIAGSPEGGMVMGSDLGRIEFKDAVPQFDAMLAEAKKAYADNDAVSRSLRQVEAKWVFIRESMVKFYENAVPFLVHRYADQIVSSIKLAIRMSS